jgi:hypothetical protein
VRKAFFVLTTLFVFAPKNPTAKSVTSISYVENDESSALALPYVGHLLNTIITLCLLMKSHLMYTHVLNSKIQ